MKTKTNLYEVLNDEINKVYGDVDGKVNTNITEEDFDKLNKEVQNEIERNLDGKPYALYSASSFAFKKISFGFVIQDMFMTKIDNKQFIKLIKSDFNFPENIVLDTGVYSKNQKIRCVGSSKDGENRPKKLIKGTLSDSLISNLPPEIFDFNFS